MADALKDSLYSRASFEDVASAFTTVYPAFDSKRFLNGIYDAQWENRSLMERMRHIPQVLRELLPQDYREAATILIQVAPRLGGKGFHVIALTEFVTLYGMDDWDTSLNAFAHLTQYGSAEFAIRPFIVRDTPRLMAQMLVWAEHENEHVRRLASEGSRPRLPWGMAIAAFKRDPSPVLPVLERLKNDPSEYVRRSVANNLNDIAKDNPQVVIDLLKRWQTDADPHVQWIIGRALRTLVKAGHSEALEILGYGDQAQVDVKPITLDRNTIRLGEALTFYAEITSTGSESQRLVIDYVVYYMRSNGKQTAKVFKLTKKELPPGETLRLQRKLDLKPITTRVYYPGEHAIALKINGQETPSTPFRVEA